MDTVKYRSHVNPVEHLNIQENPLYFEINRDNFSNPSLSATFTVEEDEKVDLDDDKAILTHNMVGDQKRARAGQPLSDGD